MGMRVMKRLIGFRKLPAAGEVLVSVQYAGAVASWDADVRRNLGDRARGPVVLGSDDSGTIAAVGPQVRGFKVGDRVYGTGIGFHVEYVKARADRIARIPKGIGFSEAGVLAISGLSAMQGKTRKLQLRSTVSQVPVRCRATP